MSLALKAEGRSISLAFSVTLSTSGEIGSTDGALDIGRGLIKEAMNLLKASAEAEGFSVDITTNLTVY